MTETVGYWVGCDKAMRDFQGEDWAIEVKTTATNGSDRLTINGERQLDDALLDRLFLHHLSVEVSRKNGQTLNRAIEDLRKALATDTIALHRFNTGLTHAGYFDEHAPMYQDRCYKIRREQAYRISGDFPRIRPNIRPFPSCLRNFDVSCETTDEARHTNLAVRPEKVRPQVLDRKEFSTFQADSGQCEVRTFRKIHGLWHLSNPSIR